MKEEVKKKYHIRFCPNCQGKLKDNKKLAQGVKECLSCGIRFFGFITTINNRVIVNN